MLDALVWSYYRLAYMLARKNINPDICLRMLKYGQNKLNIRERERERESMGQMAVKSFGQCLAKGDKFGASWIASDSIGIWVV